MRIILVYDVSVEEPKDQVRLNKVRKIARKYIHHIQKSVFEGDITPSNLERLKKEILEVVDRNRDSVIIYELGEFKSYRRYILTEGKDPSGNHNLITPQNRSLL
ncbi:MAG: CRISPR-associated endonuclease Cas2 [Aquificota bacterium]|nr:CRISPR-associated endonuclease Cas2 [Aquificota bacterium]